ncbi:MAG: T9SS type A sorting domain-containing protein [Tannerella sp.]|jgi:hypothetical protein|nr:T9SS type A sorting domain-containing protein [Tannerella sp.]
MKKIYLFFYFFIAFGALISAQHEKVIYLTIEQPELPSLYRGVDITNSGNQIDFFSEIDIRYSDLQKRLSLTFSNIAEVISVSIYNLQGQKVNSFTVEDPMANPYLELDLGVYSSGVYIVSATGANYNKTQKIYISK